MPIFSLQANVEAAAARFIAPNNTSYAKSKASHISGSEIPNATILRQHPTMADARDIMSCRSRFIAPSRCTDNWCSFWPDASVFSIVADMYRALEGCSSDRKDDGKAEEVPKRAVSSAAASCV
jgi:hypothetical protein